MLGFTDHRLTDDEQFLAQQEYYARTAAQYGDLHMSGDNEHDLALSVLVGYVLFTGAQSLLDVGSGTGRTLVRLQRDLPGLRCVGVEPSDELREVGHNHYKLSDQQLIKGNGLSLDFPDSSFDIVSEFSILHHVKRPDQVIREMLRVARQAVIVSDVNNFGQGSLLLRRVKRMINLIGLWQFIFHIRTGGRGYLMSEGDGLAYSYSVFNDIELLRSSCTNLYVMNTAGASYNHYADASHVVIIGVKR